MPHITIRGRRWFYEDKGAGFPVLLGHGYLWDHRMWAAQVSMLSSRFRCLAPDFWSHGESDPLPDGPFSLDLLAEDHLAFMRTLGIQRFAVVGHSVGGMWALRMALSHAKSVASMVLMNTSAGVEPSAALVRYSMLLDAVERAGAVPPSVQEAVQPFFFSDETLKENPALSVGFSASLGRIKKENIPGIVRLGRAIFQRPSLLPQLGSLSCPTMLLAGEKDRSRPSQESEAAAKAIPGSILQVIAGSGHVTPLDSPLQTSRLISDFLSKSLPEATP